jgi:hypothetical protein
MYDKDNLFNDVPTNIDLNFSSALFNIINKESYTEHNNDKIDFTKYKIKCYNDLIKQEVVFFENNFHNITAISHIIILRHGSYSNHLIDVYGIDYIENLHKNLISHYFDLHFNG